MDLLNLPRAAAENWRPFALHKLTRRAPAHIRHSVFGEAAGVLHTSLATKILSQFETERPTLKHSAAEFSQDTRQCTLEGGQLSTMDWLERCEGNPLWKRVLDVVIALFALVFFAPLMLLGAVLARLDGGPSLFVNRRPGYANRQIGVLKFRSMRVNAEQHLAALLSADPAAAEEFRRTAKLKNDPRITPVGRFLRVSSLDELPQLINVLRGDMSIVGPRPRTYPEMDWAAQYPKFDAYFKVRPGITGLWQVTGRSDTDYARRVELDAEYVEGLSIYNDIKILLKTIPAILFSRGAA